MVCSSSGDSDSDSAGDAGSGLGDFCHSNRMSQKQDRWEFYMVSNSFMMDTLCSFNYCIYSNISNVLF